MNIPNKPDSTPKVRKVVMRPRQLVGIDLGCTGSRIMVFCPIQRPYDDPDNILVKDIYPSTVFDHVPWDWRDFPAHGYPFDDDAPVYDFDNVRGRHHEPVPLKYAFYLLAKELDKAAPQYPMAQELAFYDSPEFRSKLYSGLVALVSIMRSSKDAYVAECLGQSFTVNRTKDHICVTIPATWNSSFQEVYLNVIAEAFGIPREIVNEDVTFVAESDAWTHHFLGPIVLILSFGGHMMNGSVYWLGPFESLDGSDTPRSTSSSGGNRFFRIGNPFGAHGGEELLVHYLLEFVDDLFSTATQRSLSPAEKSRVHDFCTELSRTQGPGLNQEPFFRVFSFFPLEVVTDTGGRVRLQMSNAAFDHFWECAYRQPFKVAAQQFALLNRIMRDCKVAGSVMIAGGGLEHDDYYSPLRVRLQQLAEDAGLKKLWFEQFFNDPEQSSAIRGTIATVEYALSAKRFITQGVGFGLQRKLPNAPEWEEHAPLVLYYDIVAREYRQYKYTKTGLQLISKKCRKPKPKNKAERVPISSGSPRPYVLFDDFPKAQNGDEYDWEVSIVESGKDTFVVVNIEQSGQLNPTRTTDLRLRLRFDPAAKLVRVVQESRIKKAI
ncbi:hypothetical protein QBC45DRAFT_469072 [Copromyces sp. CBS 386.78]|nr:hypothetical protein QBC45DRAFT_469072 [Copromyces sp. CBS 386.78]